MLCFYHFIIFITSLKALPNALECIREFCQIVKDAGMNLCNVTVGQGLIDHIKAVDKVVKEVWIT